MNLNLLHRPKRISKGTKVMYVYAPAVVTSGGKLEPGESLRILDVFEGATPSETTLKVMTAEDWETHTYKGCTRDDNRAKDGADHANCDCLCDCEKELSAMSDAFKEKVHYVLLSDVGK